MDAVCQKAGEAGARFALHMANNAVTDTPVNDHKITPIKTNIESANLTPSCEVELGSMSGLRAHALFCQFAPIWEADSNAVPSSSVSKLLNQHSASFTVSMSFCDSII